MRILYVHRGYFPALAGAEIMAHVVAERMRRLGHEVKMIMRCSGTDFQSQDRDGVELISVPTLDTHVLRERINWQPEVVHAIDAVDSAFPQAARRLADSWGASFAFTPASAIGTWQDAPAILELCRTADIVFVLTEAERELFRQHRIARERLVVIGQGAFLQGQADPITFLRQHTIDGPMVLFLGRKIWFKGYRVLLEAAAEVWKSIPSAWFVFMGPRWDPDCTAIFEAHAHRQIVELPISEEQDKHNALMACTLLCLPSMTDVFPLVYVEAWTCGKPVIAAPFAGVEEIVRHEIDGLISPATPPALASAIVRLLADPDRCRAMGAAGRERVRSEFNWDVITERIEAAYREHRQNGRCA